MTTARSVRNSRADWFASCLAAPVANSRIGAFWPISTWQTAQTITWHHGQTGGYACYLGLDRRQRKAVVIRSDVAADTTPTDLGIALLADRN